MTGPRRHAAPTQAHAWSFPNRVFTKEWAIPNTHSSWYVETQFSLFAYYLLQQIPISGC
jgi:hypothetical protein